MKLFSASYYLKFPGVHWTIVEASAARTPPISYPNWPDDEIKIEPARAGKPRTVISKSGRRYACGAQHDDDDSGDLPLVWRPQAVGTRKRLDYHEAKKDTNSVKAFVTALEAVKIFVCPELGLTGDSGSMDEPFGPDRPDLNASLTNFTYVDERGRELSWNNSQGTEFIGKVHNGEQVDIWWWKRKNKIVPAWLAWYLATRDDPPVEPMDAEAAEEPESKPAAQPDDAKPAAQPDDAKPAAQPAAEQPLDARVGSLEGLMGQLILRDIKASEQASEQHRATQESIQATNRTVAAMQQSLQQTNRDLAAEKERNDYEHAYTRRDLDILFEDNEERDARDVMVEEKLVGLQDQINILKMGHQSTNYPNDYDVASADSLGPADLVPANTVPQPEPAPSAPAPDIHPTNVVPESPVPPASRSPARSATKRSSSYAASASPAPKSNEFVEAPSAKKVRRDVKAPPVPSAPVQSFANAAASSVPGFFTTPAKTSRPSLSPRRLPTFNVGAGGASTPGRFGRKPRSSAKKCRVRAYATPPRLPHVAQASVRSPAFHFAPPLQTAAMPQAGAAVASASPAKPTPQPEVSGVPAASRGKEKVNVQAAPLFSKGSTAYYVKNGVVEAVVTIVKVHADPEGHFYTILDDGREKQTSEDCLVHPPN